VSNGGAIFGSGDIGFSSAANDNVAVVTGSASVWSNSAAANLGYFGANNSLLISNSARVFEGGLTVGSQPGATNNALSLSGTLVVTNTSQNGSLDVRRGQADFSAGTLTADRLFLTNGVSSIFNFLGGTLNVRIAS